MNRISDRTFEDYYSDLFEKVKFEIIKEKEDYIIATPTEDLVIFYASDCINPILYDDTKEMNLEQIKYVETIPAQQREWGYQNEGDLKFESEKIVVNIPILPNDKISLFSSLRTNSVTISMTPIYKIELNNIVIELKSKGYNLNLNNEQIKEIILDTKKYLTSHIHSKNEEIKKENEKFTSKLTLFINERKAKINNDNKRLNDLTKIIQIPLRRKSEDIVKKIQIDVRPFVKRIKPKSLEEDYILDKEKVLDIINLIENQCLQFEKSPKSCLSMGENDLRDFILSNLNSIFIGKATGETFNKKGKTDIYLNIDKGNILVGECKFYGGKQLYQETINQLLGYLTWRENFGIMITFCKQKNFSKILIDGESIISSHKTYKSNFSKISENHFVSKHFLPNDEYKSVEIHHLYYNLFIE